MEASTEDLEKLPEFIRLTTEAMEELQKNGKWNDTTISLLIKEEVDTKLVVLRGDKSPMEKMQEIIRIAGEFEIKREALNKTKQEKKSIFNQAREKKQKFKVPRILK